MVAVTIDVDDEVIKEARRYEQCQLPSGGNDYCGRCVLAIAVNKVLKPEFHTSIHTYNGHIRDSNNRTQWDFCLPPTALRVREAWDDGLGISPTRFIVRIKQELLC